MMSHNKRINENLLENVALDMFGGDEVTHFQDDGLRVEYILLDLVRPDPLQPRRVLPEHVYWAFHSHEITPSQALRELIQAAQLAAQQHGRPFKNVLALLGDQDDELPHFSPEEQLVRDLVNLAVTIRDDGQVNPLTVVEVSQGVVQQYRIETGERRYWATWLLRDYIPGYESDGTIPCIIIPGERASAFRQARENTARSGLSAIALARQAALLLLAVHGYDIPDGPVTLDFYRQALDL
ncbi:MAG: ParB N-terminal domain-containing protein, partial [Anaerolineae bacterium]|nr:ParB N-terminal domain-containing protein [Anaerolineae bacterium]